jgi:hypothetical protein
MSLTDQRPARAPRVRDRCCFRPLHPTGDPDLYIDDQVVAEAEIRTMTGHFTLCGEGLCIGYDGGDAVSSEYKATFAFTSGRIVKVVFDVADDAYIDVEAHLAAAMSRD